VTTVRIVFAQRIRPARAPDGSDVPDFRLHQQLIVLADDAGHRALPLWLRIQKGLRAYSPLGTGKDLRNGTVAEIAERVGRTPAQVLLRWCLQHGVPVIPKSKHRERIAANARLFDSTLAEADMAALDALDRTSGASIAREIRWRR
jgi:diketogulonate reductase-like aldo/keto reductase